MTRWFYLYLMTSFSFKGEKPENNRLLTKTITKYMQTKETDTSLEDKTNAFITELAGLHYQLYLVALCFLGVKNMLKGMVDTCASPHIYKVVDSIVHALTSPYPKSHYVVGWDAKLLWIWVSRFPAAIGDAILNLLGEKAEPSKCARANMPGDQTTRKINENNNAMNGSVLHN